MATRLKKIKVQEVSLVTRPAIAKEFLLYKSEDGASEVPVVEEVVKTEEQPVAEAPVEKAEPVVEAPPVVEVPPVEHAIDTQKEAEPIVEKAVMCPTCGQEVEEGDEEETEKAKACKACREKKGVKKEVEDITKALEMERLEKAAIIKELEELKKAAFEAKQAEITKEFVQKAAVDFKHVPAMTPATFGPVMKAASDKLAPAEFETIYTALKAASAFIAANSRLTKELGVGGEDLSADPAAQLDAIAKSYIAKDAGMTYAKAYEKACMNNPAIYAQHVRDARNR